MRMGEFATTAAAAELLTTIGLGSCVGLVVLDGQHSVAGMAHIVFPHSPNGKPVGTPGKYADTAVPALLAALTRLGGVSAAFEAVLVGGARMFAFGRSAELDIGARNVSAVTSALAAEAIPIRAALTGGSIGRSVRVQDGVVAVRQAGVDSQLYRAFRGPLQEAAR